MTSVSDSDVVVVVVDVWILDFGFWIWYSPTCFLFCEFRKRLMADVCCANIKDNIKSEIGTCRVIFPSWTE
jgi:hypothetical protein